jgi:hypothetical protein
MNSISIVTPYISKIHFKADLSSTPRSFQVTLPFKFSNQNRACTFHFSHACSMSCLSHSPDLIIRSVKYKFCRFSICSVLHSAISSSPLDPNILLSNRFPNVLSLMFFLQGETPCFVHLKTDTITVLYSLIFTFLSLGKQKHIEMNGSKSSLNSTRS